MNRTQLLQRLDAAWRAFTDSYAGLPDARLVEPGVVDAWSVKDLIAHVTTWEEEALTHLPLIVAGGVPPRYAAVYGGLDAFNALMAERKRDLPLAEIARQQDETHRRLISYLETAPDDQFTGETRFRRRLRLDTYAHYALHAAMIRAWRERHPESESNARRRGARQTSTGAPYCIS